MSRTTPVGREPVVRAALELLDGVALGGGTVRAVAAELGLRAPTLYWRFKNKQDLVDEMATQVLVDLRVGFAAGGLPQARAELTRDYARGFRAELLKRRDGARMVAGTRLRDSRVYEGMESFLRALLAGGGALPEGGHRLHNRRHHRAAGRAFAHRRAPGRLRSRGPRSQDGGLPPRPQ